MAFHHRRRESAVLQSVLRESDKLCIAIDNKFIQIGFVRNLRSSGFRLVDRNRAQ
jgi:hypothetical protein